MYDQASSPANILPRSSRLNVWSIKNWNYLSRVRTRQGNAFYQLAIPVGVCFLRQEQDDWSRQAIWTSICRTDLTAASLCIQFGCVRFSIFAVLVIANSEIFRKHQSTSSTSKNSSDRQAPLFAMVRTTHCNMLCTIMQHAVYDYTLSANSIPSYSAFPAHTISNVTVSTVIITCLIFGLTHHKKSLLVLVRQLHVGCLMAFLIISWYSILTMQAQTVPNSTVPNSAKPYLTGPRKEVLPGSRCRTDFEPPMENIYEGPVSMLKLKSRCKAFCVNFQSYMFWACEWF